MKLFYSTEQINAEIERVAAEINRDYAGKKIFLVGVMKGCIVFMSHLLVKLTGAIEMDFMTVSSYKSGTESGRVDLVKGIDADLTGKEVLIIEDILDTGKTASFVIDYLKSKGANSVEMVSLLNKKRERLAPVPEPKYSCFEYDRKEFVIGFGFDFAERYRNLPAIYLMDEEDKIIV